MDHSVLTLSSGMQIGCSIFGSPHCHHNVFYFHGLPGCRVEGGLAEQACQKLGLTFIALDRPGFGRSSPQPARTLRDWPPIVLEIATLLNVKRFSVVGVSGGAPYALACAALLGEHIISTTAISGMAPMTADTLQQMVFYNKKLLMLGGASPALAKFFLSLICFAVRSYPPLFLHWLKFVSPDCDDAILSTPPVAELMTQNVTESLLQGKSGVLDDFEILIKPWPIDLNAIQTPVSLWHGEADTYVPQAMSRYLAANIPGATLKPVPGKGHFMVVEMVQEILGEVAEKHIQS